MKPTCTIDEEIAELEQEKADRNYRYKLAVQAGRMRREEAAKRMEALSSALTRLKNLKNKNQTSLF